MAEKPVSAWIRLPVMAVLLLVADILAEGVISTVDDVPVVGLVVGLVLGCLLLLGYVGLVRWLEHRRHPAELALADAAPALGRGALLGFGLFAATLAVIALFGGYRVLGYGSVFGMLNALGLMWTVGVGEELVFRGALYRILEEKTGSYWAIVISGLVFGGVHVVNPHGTVVGALAIAVEAGLLIGAAYAATRSLWLVIGFHTAWNLAEGGIFGTAVSGSGAGPAVGLLRAVTSGPELLTGGQFGPEASIVAVIVCGVPTVLFLRLAKRRGRLVGRRRPVAA
jgi:membrane protease YdiL (CAAX protease family)